MEQSVPDFDLTSLGPGWEVPTLETVRQLSARLQGAKAPAQYVLERPSLLSPPMIEGLAADVRTLPEEEHGPLLTALQFCANGMSRFEGQREAYPIGIGPIESLLERLKRGEITADYAETLAAKLGTAGLFSLAYFRALSWFALITSAQEGDWKSALHLERLLLAACDSADSNDADVQLARTETYLDYLLTATSVLVQIPDGRVFRRALDIGKYLIEEYERTDSSEQLGHVLHRLGGLYLDPYTSQTSTSDVKLYVDRWPGRLLDMLGPDAVHLREELAMPPLREALATARGYYGRATGHREGHALAMTLKALAQTLIFQRAVGEPVEKQEIVSVLNRSLQLADGAQDPQLRAIVLAYLEGV